MIQDLIKEMQAKLQDHKPLSAQERQSLLSLLQQLDQQIKDLEKTHHQEAHNVADFTKLSMHEALRQEKNPEAFQSATHDLQSTVEAFEVTHPKLVDTVNRLCVMLANLGI